MPGLFMIELPEEVEFEVGILITAQPQQYVCPVVIIMRVRAGLEDVHKQMTQGHTLQDCLPPLSLLCLIDFTHLTTQTSILLLCITTLQMTLGKSTVRARSAFILQDPLAGEI